MRLERLALQRQARRLLEPWTPGATPGCTLGLVQDGALLLHECAGLASLEFAVPIARDTRFRIASVSKQFTCAAILLLEADGRLARTDPLRRHLPELPTFGLPEGGAAITLDHLMRNTSGLRDMLELLRLGGVDLSHPLSAGALAEAVGRQRGLNFPPGSRFLYSNTGFMLLGQVIERVAGEPLGAFLERRLLAPAGMTRTLHTPETATVVPGLATGYLQHAAAAGTGFRRAGHGFPLGGEGGLVSGVEDLALWDRWLDRTGAPLAEVAPFTNGHPNDYALGQEVARHRGLRTVGHGGLWPGYRTAFLRVPELRLTVIAIANHAGIDVHHLAHRLLDAALEGTAGLHPPPSRPAATTLQPLLGCWIEADGATTLELFLDEAGQLMARQHGVPFALIPLPDGRLAARRGAFPFRLSRPVEDALEVETDAGRVTRYGRAPATAAMPTDLAGRWWCDELGTAWQVAAEGDGWTVRPHGPLAAAAGPWPLQAIAPDALRVHAPGPLWNSWFDVAVRRDADGVPASLVASGARARALTFLRTVGSSPA